MSRQKINRYEVRHNDKTNDWGLIQVYPETKTKRRYSRRIDSTVYKESAVRLARSYARLNAPSQLRVRDLKGRWKIEASYGVDSKRRKG